MSFEGEGTQENPYKITNIQQLQRVKDELDAHYELTQDIDASKTRNWNDGKGFKPIGGLDTEFTGVIEGNNHTIKQLHISREREDYIGLFGKVKDGNIVDLNVTGVVEAGKDSGILIGRNDHGKVENISVNGTITGERSIGGLIGVNYGRVVDCYITGEVNGTQRIGGIIGRNIVDKDTNGGVVMNCGTSSDVFGERYTGSIAGINHTKILFCYGLGKVTGGNAGIIGINSFKDSLLMDCFGVTDKDFTANNNGIIDNSGTIVLLERLHSYDEKINVDVRIELPHSIILYDAREKILVVINDAFSYPVRIDPTEVNQLMSMYSNYVTTVSNNFRTMFVTEKI